MRKLFHIGVRTLKRAMDRVVGEVQEKWLVVVAVDEVNSFTGQRIGQVFTFYNGLTTPCNGIVGIVVWLVATHMIGINESFFSNPTAGVSMWQTLAAQHRCHTFIRWRYEVMALV